MAETIPLLWLPMFLHCLIGLVAAQVAFRKGYDLGIWLLWGIVGGTPALIDALRRPRCGAIDSR
ncbi:MAG: hypothetical protein ACHWZW_13755 [Spirulina sp.]